MLLIVGLGNKGEKYKHTPHNAGFEALDYFYEEHKDACDSWKLDKKAQALIARGKIEESHEVDKTVELIMAKPQTFMNNSGFAVKKLMSGARCQVEGVIIVHDDIDLPLGAIRIRKSGSSAGHKGVQSIIDALGTENFTRIRIGIKPAPEFTGDAYKLVLKKISKEKQKLFQKVFQRVNGCLMEIFQSGVEERTITVV